MYLLKNNGILNTPHDSGIAICANTIMSNDVTWYYGLFWSAQHFWNPQAIQWLFFSVHVNGTEEPVKLFSFNNCKVDTTEWHLSFGRPTPEHMTEENSAAVP